MTPPRQRLLHTSNERYSVSMQQSQLTLQSSIITFFCNSLLTAASASGAEHVKLLYLELLLFYALLCAGLLCDAKKVFL